MDKLKASIDLVKCALVLLIVLFVIRPMTTSLAKLMDRLAAQPATAEVISSRVILSSLRGIGRLVTVTSDPHTRDVHVGIKRGFTRFDEFASYGGDHQAEGIIEAGIDFTEIRSDSLRCEETCTLLVPHPTITNCTIVRLRQSDQSFALGGRDWELLEELGRYEAVKLFIEDSKELGILEKAKEETELVLGEFVSGLTGKPVHVAFEDQPDELEYGATCLPEPPFGWTKVDGAWQESGE
ncbi:MAG: DUF4230 domain-containing protein [Chloroflexi bacterium]|nr:DUF4230 domain-containing protein [Chloroflexota bacterium]